MQNTSAETRIHFSEKFIAFVDVLGFTNLVEDAEAGRGMRLDELVELVKCLGSNEDQKKIERRGPTTCPHSGYTQRNLDFRITQISDCVVVSSEISPAGIINLMNHCWVAVIRLLQSGIMCRGYITRGSIYHTDAQVIGTGYQRAFRNERQVGAFKREADERGTPFVEVDKSVCDYVSSSGDTCVTEMFSRMVKADGDTVVLFPFKRLAHNFVIRHSEAFDPDRNLRANENVRTMVRRLKDQLISFVDITNPDAVRKSEHYLRCLDVQLAVCDQTEAFLKLYKS